MAPIKATQQVILVIGNQGSDGGYSVLTPNGLIHVPGNNPVFRGALDALLKANAHLLEVAERGA